MLDLSAGRPFPSTRCPLAHTESIAAVSAHCAANDKIYCMNLSAPFIMQVPPFKKVAGCSGSFSPSPADRIPESDRASVFILTKCQVLMDALPFIDFLFGNEIEAATFAETEGWQTKDLAEVALKVGFRLKGRIPECSA